MPSRCTRRTALVLAAGRRTSAARGATPADAVPPVRAKLGEGDCANANAALWDERDPEATVYRTRWWNDCPRPNNSIDPDLAVATSSSVLITFLQDEGRSDSWRAPGDSRPALRRQLDRIEEIGLRYIAPGSRGRATRGAASWRCIRDTLDSFDVREHLRERFAEWSLPAIPPTRHRWARSARRCTAEPEVAYKASAARRQMDRQYLGIRAVAELTGRDPDQICVMANDLGKGRDDPWRPEYDPLFGSGVNPEPRRQAPAARPGRSVLPAPLGSSQRARM